MCKPPLPKLGHGCCPPLPVGQVPPSPTFLPLSAPHTLWPWGTELTFHWQKPGGQRPTSCMSDTLTDVRTMSHVLCSTSLHNHQRQAHQSSPDTQRCQHPLLAHPGLRDSGSSICDAMKVPCPPLKGLQSSNRHRQTAVRGLICHPPPPRSWKETVHSEVIHLQQTHRGRVPGAHFNLGRASVSLSDL